MEMELGCRFPKKGAAFFRTPGMAHGTHKKSPGASRGFFVNRE